MVSAAQESRSSLVGQWGVESVRRLPWLGLDNLLPSFQGGLPCRLASWCWLLVGASAPPYVGLSMSCLSVLMTWAGLGVIWENGSQETSEVSITSATFC